MIRQDVNLGLVCRNVRTSGFKLALVVGYPSTSTAAGQNACRRGRLRVRFWRAASACWTLPTLVDVDTLEMLVEADHKKRHAVIKRASQMALDLRYVGRVWS